MLEGNKTKDITITLNELHIGCSRRQPLEIWSNENNFDKEKLE